VSPDLARAADRDHVATLRRGAAPAPARLAPRLPDRLGASQQLIAARTPGRLAPERRAAARMARPGRALRRDHGEHRLINTVRNQVDWGQSFRTLATRGNALAVQVSGTLRFTDTLQPGPPRPYVADRSTLWARLSVRPAEPWQPYPPPSAPLPWLRSSLRRDAHGRARRPAARARLTTRSRRLRSSSSAAWPLPAITYKAVPRLGQAGSTQHSAANRTCPITDAVFRHIGPRLSAFFVPVKSGSVRGSYHRVGQGGLGVA
jgi:hypothetical protein